MFCTHFTVWEVESGLSQECLNKNPVRGRKGRPIAACAHRGVRQDRKKAGGTAGEKETALNE